jgi:hypothetical protein
MECLSAEDRDGSENRRTRGSPEALRRADNSDRYGDGADHLLDLAEAGEVG